jgi:hypothetical protein
MQVETESEFSAFLAPKNKFEKEPKLKKHSFF